MNGNRGKTEQKSERKTEQEAQWETCVCCHRKIRVVPDQPIEFRAFYIEGAGQLCYDCYQEIYGNRKRSQ